MKLRAECLKCKKIYDLEIDDSKAETPSEKYFKQHPLICKGCEKN